MFQWLVKPVSIWSAYPWWRWWRVSFWSVICRINCRLQNVVTVVISERRHRRTGWRWYCKCQHFVICSAATILFLSIRYITRYSFRDTIHDTIRLVIKWNIYLQEAKLKKRLPALDGDRDTASDSGRSLHAVVPVVDKSIALHVYSVDDPGPEITVELVEVLQNRINEAMLEVLSVVLSRNPNCKLTYADVRVSLLLLQLQPISELLLACFSNRSQVQNHS